MRAASQCCSHRFLLNVNDSDHSYYRWLWHETLFMDPYLVNYPRENRNLCVSPTKGVCTGPDTRYDNLRDNLGYIVRYSRKLDLTNMAPRDRLCSRGFCLAPTASAGAEYLVYTPSGGTFTVDLSAMPASRRLAVEWFNPSTGAVTTANPIPSGSSAQAFTPPFSGDAVLYLVDTKAHYFEVAAELSARC